MRITSKFVSIATRWTAWSEGQVFTIAPEQIGVVDGIRAAVGMAVTLGASIYLNLPDLGFAAVAVFWTCLCDPGGSDKTRLGTLVWFVVFGSMVMTLASYSAHWGQLVGGIGLFVLVLVCGLTRTYKASFGPTPAQGGLIAAVAVVIGISSPRGLVGSLELGSYFLGGGIWAIVLSLYIWPTRSSAPGRQSLVAIFSRLDEMLRSLEELDALPGSDDTQWIWFNTVYRRAARISIERGRAVVARMVVDRSRYSGALDAAGRTFAAIIAMGHFRRQSTARLDQQSERPLLGGLRRAMQLIVQQADEPKRDPKIILSELASLSKQAETVDNTVGRAVSFASRALQELMTRWENPPSELDPLPAAAFLPSMSFNAAILRHSLRVSTAVLVCYLIGITFDVSFSYWGSIATLVIMQPLIGNTWLRVLERAAGSLIGGLIAALLIAQLSAALQMAIVIVPLSAAVIALRLVNYGIFVIFLTPMFMLLSDYIRPAEGLILARVVNECLGACLGLAASFLLWPDKEIDGVPALLSDATKSNLEFASAVLRNEAEASAALDQLQRDAGVASSRVEAAGERLWLQGRRKSARLEALGELAVALRSICGAAAIIEISRPQSVDAKRAEYFELLSAGLQMQLKSLKREALPAPPTISDKDDLSDAVQALVAAVQNYAVTKGETIWPLPGNP